MKRLALFPFFLLIVSLIALSLAAVGQQGPFARGTQRPNTAPTPTVVNGLIKNGTTNKPAAGDDVILLKLSQGMEEQLRTKSNAQGKFTLKIPDGNVPHLIRVRHQNVNYHEPAMPGATNVEITVYDAASSVTGVKVLDQSDIFEAQGNALRGIKLFRLENTSSPPLTQPSFDFYLPEGATVQLGQAVSANGMPIKSAPIPSELEKGKYSFVYPIRPGVTQYEVVYTLPYVGSMKIDSKLAMGSDKLFVVTPKSITFSGGSEFHPDQWSIEPNLPVDTRAIDNPKAGMQLSFTISGTGVLPDNNPNQQASAGGKRGAPAEEDNRPGGGMGVPNEKPDPLHSGQWVFLGMLTLFLAGGGVMVFFVNRQPAPAAAPMPMGQDASARSAALLEALKEEMFQLESDRVKNKIAQQDYDKAKAALDNTLQRAMKRQG